MERKKRQQKRGEKNNQKKQVMQKKTISHHQLTNIQPVPKQGQPHQPPPVQFYC